MERLVCGIVFFDGEYLRIFVNLKILLILYDMILDDEKLCSYVLIVFLFFIVFG